MNFGEFIRNKRLSLDKSLREFCKETGYDVAYVSRLETEIMTPPAEEDKLAKLALAYQIKNDSEDWHQFMDLASISNKQLPKNLDAKVINYLPAFFRKASKKEITKKDVETLVNLIKGK
ncbi:helix-turn-helix transcriptional regulator [Candidatus Shapirobacteria bacterium]|nr:helix-turn-helix transcriptional regulator [Candidatus Shapirobacteria bacterium]